MIIGVQKPCNEHELCLCGNTQINCETFDEKALVISKTDENQHSKCLSYYTVRNVTVVCEKLELFSVKQSLDLIRTSEKLGMAIFLGDS